MWLFPLLLSGAALAIVLTKKTDAADETTAEIPTVDDILAAENESLLDYYYEIINAAFFEGVITADEYDLLYMAYEERWWEL